MKFLKITLFTFLLLSTAMKNNAQWSGTGDANNPFQLSTTSDLTTLAVNVNAGNHYDDVHFRLTSDIDLSGFTGSDGNGWDPIGNDINSFYGIFHGAGHTISNLHINRPGSQYQALFGFVISDGAIDSLGLVNATIKGGNETGGIVGFLFDGEIRNCFVSGFIEGNSGVGALIGHSGTGGPVHSCHATGGVRGFEKVGGLVGDNNGVISNSYATNSVSAVGVVGGIAGINYEGTIENCIAANPFINGAYLIGRIFGFDQGLGTLSNNYANEDMKVNGSTITSSDVNSDNGGDATPGNLQMQNFYTSTLGWDLSVWSIWPGNSYLYFTWQSAPVAASLNATPAEINFTLLNSADSVQVFDMHTFLRIATITSGLTPGSHNYPLSLSITDTIGLSVYENGKIPSYWVTTGVTPPLPESTTWEGTIDSDWSNADNWENNIIPVAGMDALIPSNRTNYPILDNADGAICDTIYFEMGSEVAKTNYLNYKHAKIDLTLDAANRWWMLSAPLHNMYSGDFHVIDPVLLNGQTGLLANFRYNPRIYMQKYQTENPQFRYIAQSATWSGSFNSLTDNLNPGSSFVVKVKKANDADETTFNFPKDSVNYSYFGNLTGIYMSTDPITMSRINYGRFVYELGDYPNNTVPGGNGEFSVNVNGGIPSWETIIVGNPFMSHLDFTAFIDRNNTPVEKLENSYHIWMDGEFIANLIADWHNGVSTSPIGNDNFIAPMQSFIVKKTAGAGEVSSVIFGPDMSVTSTNHTLKSSSLEQIGRLDLSIKKGAKRQSGATLLYRQGENNSYNPKKDVWTLFNEDADNLTPIIYMMVDNKAASIHTVGDLSVPVELGLRSKAVEKLTIEVKGLDSFEPTSTILLEDRANGLSVDLRAQSSYTFDAEAGNITNRFFLRVSNSSTGIRGNTLPDHIEIKSRPNVISISSETGDPIREVEIADIQGIILYKNTGYNDHLVFINKTFTTGILIIKVKAEQSRKIEKVMIHNN